MKVWTLNELFRLTRAELFGLHRETVKALAEAPEEAPERGRFRSDAKWRHFRDTCVIPMMEADPDNPDWPRHLAQVEDILAWRASIPAEDRFWKLDAGDTV